MHNNYGDVALALDASWNRSNYENQAEWVLYTVGHQEGVADVYLEKEPEKKHNFRWVDMITRSGFTPEFVLAQQRGFRFVKKADGWVLRDEDSPLWQWDAEGFLLHAGQRLMARPAEKFYAELERRSDVQRQVQGDSDQDIDRVPEGLTATDATGKVLKRRKKGI